MPEAPRVARQVSIPWIVLNQLKNINVSIYEEQQRDIITHILSELINNAQFAVDRGQDLGQDSISLISRAVSISSDYALQTELEAVESLIMRDPSCIGGERNVGELKRAPAKDFHANAEQAYTLIERSDKTGRGPPSFDSEQEERMLLDDNQQYDYPAQQPNEDISVFNNSMNSLKQVLYESIEYQKHINMGKDQPQAAREEPVSGLVIGAPYERAEYGEAGGAYQGAGVTGRYAPDYAGTHTERREETTEGGKEQYHGDGDVGAPYKVGWLMGLVNQYKDEIGRLEREVRRESVEMAEYKQINEQQSVELREMAVRIEELRLENERLRGAGARTEQLKASLENNIRRQLSQQQQGVEASEVTVLANRPRIVLRRSVHQPSAQDRVDGRERTPRDFEMAVVRRVSDMRELDTYLAQFAPEALASLRLQPCDTADTELRQMVQAVTDDSSALQAFCCNFLGIRFFEPSPRYLACVRKVIRLIIAGGQQQLLLDVMERLERGVQGTAAQNNLIYYFWEWANG